MSDEPPIKRAIAFIDGQNLFHAARLAFGYNYPNFNAKALARAVCAGQGWQLKKTQLYTGVPRASDDADWHASWSQKFRTMAGQDDVTIFQRPLEYRNEWVELKTGQKEKGRVLREEGIDVLIAVDVMELAILKEYDVALIFSQDQSFSALAQVIRTIASEQNRWIKIASAFPYIAEGQDWSHRGIEETDWIPIDRKVYDECLEQWHYTSPQVEARYLNGAVMEAFSAIEVRISEVVDKLKVAKGVSNKKIGQYKKQLDINYKMNVDLRVLLHPLSDHEDDVLKQVNDVRGIRNQVAHQQGIATSEDVKKTEEVKEKVFEMLRKRNL